MIYKLTNWAIISDPYCAPEFRKSKLQGNLQTSERLGFYLDEFITTSSIVGKTLDNNIATRNSVYSIADEDAHPDYIKAFPAAKARLLLSLPLVAAP